MITIYVGWTYLSSTYLDDLFLVWMYNAPADQLCEKCDRYIKLLNQPIQIVVQSLSQLFTHFQFFRMCQLPDVTTSASAAENVK